MAKVKPKAKRKAAAARPPKPLKPPKPSNKVQAESARFGANIKALLGV